MLMSRLVDEALDELGMLHKVRGQDLDRRALSDFAVNRLEDRAHAALAELAHDVVLTDVAADEVDAVRRLRRKVEVGDRADGKSARTRLYLLRSVYDVLRLLLRLCSRRPPRDILSESP